MFEVRCLQFGYRTFCRIHIRTVVVAMVVMCFSVFVMATLYFRLHLWWIFTRHCHGLKELAAIPTAPLPPAPVPSNWIRCQVGEFELSLPPEFATTGNDVSKNKCTVFTSGTKTILVGPPTPTGEALRLLIPTTLQLCGKVKTMSVPQLKLECYQTSSDMFSWSMSPSQVQWHAFVMEICRIVRPMSGSMSLAEYAFDGDIDAVIAFGPKHAILDWESKGDGVGGYIHFIDVQNDVDSDWIRSVCRSIVRSKNILDERNSRIVQPKMKTESERHDNPM